LIILDDNQLSLRKSDLEKAYGIIDNPKW